MKKLEEEKKDEEILCLPTKEAGDLFKAGVSMKEVIAQLGENAWEEVPLSALGTLTPDELGKIHSLSNKWLTSKLIYLEDKYSAAGNSL